MINLLLAVAWGLLGVGLIVYHAATDDPRFRLRLGDTNLSIGWFALLLVAYNLARWWNSRSGDLERQARAIAEAARRRRQQRERAAEPGREPDPNFDFTSDPPPQPPSPGEQPPPGK
jgi:hypothetical protein